MCRRSTAWSSRLLNPVACGKTWYGTYGYQFGKGSFRERTAATHAKPPAVAAVPSGERQGRFERMAGIEIDPPRSAGEASDRTEPALEVIARYEALMKQYAPTTVGGLVAAAPAAAHRAPQRQGGEGAGASRAARGGPARRASVRLPGKRGRAGGGGADKLAQTNGKGLAPGLAARKPRRAQGGVFAIEPLKFRVQSRQGVTDGGRRTERGAVRPLERAGRRA